MIKNYYQYLKENLEDNGEDLDYEEEEDADEFITDPEFRKFLIDHKCLRSYAEQVIGRDEKNISMNPGYRGWAKTTFDKCGRDYINQGLSWNQTEEGQNYWQNLSNEWMKIVNKKREAEEKIEKKRQAIIIKRKLEKIKKGEEKDFITDDAFRQFLIDHKALDTFLFNAYCFTADQIIYYTKNYGKDYVKNNKVHFFTDQFEAYKKGRDYIANGVSFQKTKEGYKFWSDLNVAWHQYLKGIQDKEKAEIRKKKAEVKKLEGLENKKKLLAIKKGEGKDFITNDDFRQFLIDNKAYELYLKNCNWASKKEYWQDLENKWMEYLKELRKKDKGDSKIRDDDFIVMDEFRDFLMDNNAYEQYLDNCFEKPYYKDWIENIDKHTKQNPAGLINNAFTWAATKQGGQFWTNLSNKWMKEIQKIKKNI